MAVWDTLVGSGNNWLRIQAYGTSNFSRSRFSLRWCSNEEKGLNTTRVTLPLLPNLVSEGLSQDTADAFSRLVARYNLFFSAATGTANFSGVILGFSTTTSTRKPSQSC
jgi:hypothetical protein